MPTNRETFPVEFKGGLVTNLSPLQQGINMPGSAITLKNFEPSIVGTHTTPTAEDTFTIAGVSGTYTVDSPAFDGTNNRTTLALTTSLASSPANGAAVTFVTYEGTYRTLGAEVFKDNSNNKTSVLVALNADIYKTSGSGFTKINVPSYIRLLLVLLFLLVVLH